MQPRCSDGEEIAYARSLARPLPGERRVRTSDVLPANNRVAIAQGSPLSQRLQKFQNALDPFSLVSPFRPRVSPFTLSPPLPLPLPAPSLQFAFSRYSRMPSQREQIRRIVTRTISRRDTLLRVNVALSIDRVTIAMTRSISIQCAFKR